MPDFTSFNIMKQCKKILEKVTALPTAIAEVKELVATNNTASETGTLSQKASQIIALNKAHGSLSRSTAGTQNWTCPAGVYQVYVTIISASGGGGGGEAEEALVVEVVAPRDQLVVLVLEELVVPEAVVVKKLWL